MKKIAVGVLAGGKSTRMGENKALLQINGKRFLNQICGELGDFSQVIISAARKGDYEDLGLDVVYDEHQDIGPIEGIYQVLSHAQEEYVFICAADMPFITKNSIEVLCNKVDKNTDGVVFYDKNNKLYPLGAIYSKNVLPIIEEMIEKKYYKLSYLIEKSNFVKINIEKTDIPLKVLSNINTLQEYDLFINNESLF